MILIAQNACVWQQIVHSLAGQQILSAKKSGVAPGIFRRGAESSDEGAKMWFSGYYKCQKSTK